MSTLAPLALVVDPAGPVPPFEQVRGQLAEQILHGRLPAGTRLPTVRALAEQLDLAANTVARSYRELEAAGLVRTAGRNGTVVAATGDAARAQAAHAAATYAAAVTALGLGAQEAVALVTAALEALPGHRGD